MNLNFEREARSVFLNAGATPETAPWWLQFAWWPERWAFYFGRPAASRTLARRRGGAPRTLLAVGPLRIIFQRRETC